MDGRATYLVEGPTLPSYHPSSQVTPCMAEDLVPPTLPSYHPSQVTPCMAEDLVAALHAKRLSSLEQRQAACADSKP